MRFLLAGSFRVLDAPHADEGSRIISMISVIQGRAEARGAELAINGVRVPGDGHGRFDVSSAPGLAVGPSSRVNIVATAGAQQVHEEFTCPPDVRLSAPVESATVHVGDQLAVTWKLAESDALNPDASILLMDYNFAMHRNVDVLIPDDGPRRQIVDKHRQETTLTVPPHGAPEIPGAPAADGYSVELWTAGTPGILRWAMQAVAPWCVACTCTSTEPSSLPARAILRPGARRRSEARPARGRYLYERARSAARCYPAPRHRRVSAPG